MCVLQNLALSTCITSIFCTCSLYYFIIILLCTCMYECVDYSSLRLVFTVFSSTIKKVSSYLWMCYGAEWKLQTKRDLFVSRKTLSDHICRSNTTLWNKNGVFLTYVKNNWKQLQHLLTNRFLQNQLSRALASSAILLAPQFWKKIIVKIQGHPCPSYERAYIHLENNNYYHYKTSRMRPCELSRVIVCSDFLI